MGGKWDSFKTLSLGSGPYVGPEWPTLDMHTRAQRDNRCASWGPRGWVLQPRGGSPHLFLPVQGVLEIQERGPSHFCLCRAFPLKVLAKHLWMDACIDGRYV